MRSCLLVRGILLPCLVSPCWWTETRFGRQLAWGQDSLQAHILSNFFTMTRRCVAVTILQIRQRVNTKYDRLRGPSALYPLTSVHPNPRKGLSAQLLITSWYCSRWIQGSDKVCFSLASDAEDPPLARPIYPSSTRIRLLHCIALEDLARMISRVMLPGCE